MWQQSGQKDRNGIFYDFKPMLYRKAYFSCFKTTCDPDKLIVDRDEEVVIHTICEYFVDDWLL